VNTLIHYQMEMKSLYFHPWPEVEKSRLRRIATDEQILFAF
jgi:hypothetical protein